MNLILPDTDNLYFRFRAVLDHTFANGGATFDGTGAIINPATGFAVATGPQRSFDIAAVPDTFAKFCQMVREAAEHAADPRLMDPYFGTWINDGRMYVEPTVIIQDRESALDLARFTGQLAIYDFARGETIRVRKD